VKGGEVANLWTDLTRWLEEVSKVVGKEAGDLTLKGRLKLEIFEEKQKLKEFLAELGAMVFEAVYVKKNKTWERKRKIQLVVRNIKRIQTRLKKKESEYKKIGKTTKKK
jgi:hypothetical protein